MGTPSSKSFEKDPTDKNQSSPDHGECLKILNLVLDEEANEEEMAYFKKHLQNCMPYYEIYNVDRTIKELIRKNCYNKEVPRDLVDSIREKIFQQAD